MAETFKLSLSAFIVLNVLNGLAPQYTTEILQPYTMNRNFRSSNSNTPVVSKVIG